MTRRDTLRQLADHLANGDLSAESYVDQCVRKARAASGVFVSIDEAVIAQAAQVDLDRQSRQRVPVLAGIPITLKDLFDVKGQKTLAGSKMLRNRVTPVTQDGEVVAALRKAGLLFLGRTTMSEFAFSGMGLNPHHDRLTSVWDRQTGRLPGGSSSGSAVSVAEGIVPATMGSDTAGSCRIPATFNGIVGVKPSFGRLSLKGVFPLSPTSDAPGPLAADVDSCFILDQVITGAVGPTQSLPKIDRPDPSDLRLLVPQSIVLEELDDTVGKAFYRTLDWLEQAGVTLVKREMPAIDGCVEMFAHRAIVLYEAWQYHRQWLVDYEDEYDPFVRRRIKTGQQITEVEQQTRYAEKAKLVQDFHQQFSATDTHAVIYPTVSCIAPAVSETQDPDKIAAVNLRCLRNTATANYFDGCSLTLPCHIPGQTPVGLMVSSLHGEDLRLYQTAEAIESVLNPCRFA